ncbi:MAG TPA: glycosyltransferase [Candidatus Hydrogenedentes bacterium]|nr:glycosyltransferase [Candidatus Hydrogenedentota bacterium]HPG69424.1 glycosyltransferase [Candidatus Hydrogenedentota bacterium]
MEIPISIVIPAYNQVEYCRQCIDSIRANTRHSYRLVLVDNGSTDGVREYFDSVPNAEVVHCATNSGFAGGVNRGLERSRGHVVLLNSDTLVPEGWLERLEAALLSAPDIGMVGPRSNCVSGEQQIDGLEFASMDEINAFAHDLAKRRSGALTDMTRLVGFCCLIRESALARVGPFDESFGIGNYEDDDYCLRLRAAGYRLCIAQDAFVFHYGSRTFLGMGVTGDKWQMLIDANQRRFEKKWRLTAEARHEAAQASLAFNAQACAARARGDFLAAVRLLKQAIEAHPLLEINFNDLGVVLCDLGQPERAVDQFVRALRLRADYTEARQNLCELATKLGREDKLAQWLRGPSADGSEENP